MTITPLATYTGTSSLSGSGTIISASLQAPTTTAYFVKPYMVLGNLANSAATITITPYSSGTVLGISLAIEGGGAGFPLTYTKVTSTDRTAFIELPDVIIAPNTLMSFRVKSSNSLDTSVQWGVVWCDMLGVDMLANSGVSIATPTQVSAVQTGITSLITTQTAQGTVLLATSTSAATAVTNSLNAYNESHNMRNVLTGLFWQITNVNPTTGDLTIDTDIDQGINFNPEFATLGQIVALSVTDPVTSGTGWITRMVTGINGNVVSIQNGTDAIIQTANYAQFTADIAPLTTLDMLQTGISNTLTVVQSQALNRG